LLHHILPALVFASQSPYSGWQNVANLERYAPVVLKYFGNMFNDILTKIIFF
jgi:hypothetical protein